MKVFVVTFSTSYGEFVEIISAHSKESCEKYISGNAKGWGYEIQELDLSKEGNIIEAGGDNG